MSLDTRGVGTLIQGTRNRSTYWKFEMNLEKRERGVLICYIMSNNAETRQLTSKSCPAITNKLGVSIINISVSSSNRISSFRKYQRRLLL